MPSSHTTINQGTAVTLTLEAHGWTSRATIIEYQVNTVTFALKLQRWTSHATMNESQSDGSIVSMAQLVTTNRHATSSNPLLCTLSHKTTRLVLVLRRPTQRIA
jgi:hypothetical protein